MEKTHIQDQQKIANENLTLQNRKSIKIEGIIEILSSNDASISLKMKDTTLFITGSNINITRLDVSTGIIEADGIFNSIRFGKSGNIFTRLFKWKFLMFYNWKTSE